MKKKSQQGPAAEGEGIHVSKVRIEEIIYAAKLVLAMYRQGIILASEAAVELNKIRKELGLEPRRDMAERIQKNTGRIE